MVVWDPGGKKKWRETAPVPCALDVRNSCLARRDEKPAVRKIREKGDCCVSSSGIS
jgi:hypothetical protein